MAEMFLILDNKNKILLTQSANIIGQEQSDRLTKTANKAISMIDNLLVSNDKRFFYAFYTDEQNVSMFVTSDGMRIVVLTKDKDRDEVFEFICDIFDYYRSEYFMDSDDFFDKGASDDNGSYFSLAR
ncbi:hypothetical protein TUBRATIS_003750 [Tubulinosema ratisbonensis]|uniref:Uncharacterized protein n=1 Tax=Tubulinosema ratisbonensis TaxID=291195 RepID=A0A437APJ6_9MICR|nr:hypothetical protein TUBRATIS_003750 [Tubulinosema ratisbonensis]